MKRQEKRDATKTPRIFVHMSGKNIETAKKNNYFFGCYGLIRYLCSATYREDIFYSLNKYLYDYERTERNKDREKPTGGFCR